MDGYQTSPRKDHNRGESSPQPSEYRKSKFQSSMGNEYQEDLDLDKKHTPSEILAFLTKQRQDFQITKVKEKRVLKREKSSEIYKFSHERTDGNSKHKFGMKIGSKVEQFQQTLKPSAFGDKMKVNMEKEYITKYKPERPFQNQKSISDLTKMNYQNSKITSEPSVAILDKSMKNRKISQSIHNKEIVSKKQTSIVQQTMNQLENLNKDMDQTFSDRFSNISSFKGKLQQTKDRFGNTIQKPAWLHPPQHKYFEKNFEQTSYEKEPYDVKEWDPKFKAVRMRNMLNSKDYKLKINWKKYGLQNKNQYFEGSEADLIYAGGTAISDKPDEWESKLKYPPIKPTYQKTRQFSKFRDDQEFIDVSEEHICGRYFNQVNIYQSPIPIYQKQRQNSANSLFIDNNNSQILYSGTQSINNQNFNSSNNKNLSMTGQSRPYTQGGQSVISKQSRMSNHGEINEDEEFQDDRTVISLNRISKVIKSRESKRSLVSFGDSGSGFIGHAWHGKDGKPTVIGIKQEKGLKRYDKNR